MNILVTGGAGYIGSFMCKSLCDQNFSVVVVDSLEKGFKEAVDSRAKFIHRDLHDERFLEELFTHESIDAVIHFAGYISMAESMQSPYKYFSNNTFTTLKLLNAMIKHNIKMFIFSSTAGVYGNPLKIPIPEDHPKVPQNPYGESKAMVEQILFWYQKIYGISFAALRYFNASGAALDGSKGENHEPETHIIPNAIKAVLTNSEFTLFGNDYDTPDRTAIRDYIHVLDLVEAHLLVLRKLEKDKGAYIYNVGTGIGHSNKEIVEEIKKYSGIDLKVVIAPRRKGDASRLIADPSKINKELDFSPKYSDLATIIKSAFEWHKRNLK